MAKQLTDLSQEQQEILVERALIGIDYWIEETKQEHRQAVDTHNIQLTAIALDRLKELYQERDLYREINKSFSYPLQDTK